MKLKLIEEDKAKAEIEYKKYLEFCKNKTRKKVKTDPFYKKMKSIYYQLKKGYQIINVKDAILKAGLNEKNEPKMAIARADMKTVAFRDNYMDYYFTEITKESSWRWNERTNIVFRVGNWKIKRVIDNKETTLCPISNLKTIVPKIPPEHVPEGNLKSYHILWEVKDWKVIPKDPVLLKRVTKDLFVVLAKWDLTKLERLVLKETIM